MRIWLKIFIGLVSFLVLSVGGVLIYLKTAYPKIGPAQDIAVELTPERISRGKYIAHHVAVCIDCHSTRDWSLFAGPPINGTWGMGGEVFDQKFGFPGSFISRNITPAGVGTWSDGELFRAITSGVSKDGKALFPIMQYLAYGSSDKEDIYSIIAYIRTLPAIENNVPKSTADFPVNFIINTMPTEPSFTTIPNKSDKVAYGKYLTTMAACIECHTKAENGQRTGPDFAGGFEFVLPNMTIYSKNITPDEKTGIGSWSEEQFVNRFKKFVGPDYKPTQLGPDNWNTPMPWSMYGGMTREDLSAIYAYLRTVTPVNNITPPFIF